MGILKLDFAQFKRPAELFKNSFERPQGFKQQQGFHIMQTDLLEWSFGRYSYLPE